MKHLVGYNVLSRNTGHRKAMLANMMTSLFRYGRIRTTKAKALEVRRYAEKIITRSKIDTVHNRRIVWRSIKDKAILAKLFTKIGPDFAERAGGYTRVLKIGPRNSDAAEMAMIEIIGAEFKEDSDGVKKKKSKDQPAVDKKVDTNAKVKTRGSKTQKDSKKKGEKDVSVSRLIHRKSQKNK